MYSNVFYIPHFNVIGGIETYIYELVKKYHKYDITDDIDYPEQIEKLENKVKNG